MSDFSRTLRAPRRRTLAAKVAGVISGGGHFIQLPHPPSAEDKPRYGYGRPPHRRLSELLSKHDSEYFEALRRLEAYADDWFAIPLDETRPDEPHWRNGFLFGIDGVALYGFTRERSPRRYIEVGSGNSTLFVDRARRDGATNTEIISIDPDPRREIDSICDRVIRLPLESTDLELFEGLQDGDMVFVDGTHRVFMNSDVNVFFLDVLPELPPGVLVGIHDIQLPYDYPPAHADRYCSEQYLLAALLLGEPDWMRPVLPCWYVSCHAELAGLVESLTPKVDFHEGLHGATFWLSTEPRRAISAAA
jgi:hypothetical protein